MIFLFACALWPCAPCSENAFKMNASDIITIPRRGSLSPVAATSASLTVTTLPSGGVFFMKVMPTNPIKPLLLGIPNYRRKFTVAYIIFTHVFPIIRKPFGSP